MSETIINGIIEEYQEIDGTMRYAMGAPGADGVGISDISKTSTVGKIDTYTITLTDGTSKIFTVTNGDDGVNGISVSTASINAIGHLIVTLSDGTSVDAGVAKGDTGDSGVYIGTTPPTDPSIKVWIDTSGEAGDVEMTSNKVTSISLSSTDIQYPSAKAVEEAINTKYELIEELTLTENAGLVNFSQEPNGTPYNFKSVIIEATTRNSDVNKNGYFRIYKDNVVSAHNLIFTSSIQYYLIGNKEAKQSFKIDKISNNQLLSVFVSGGNPSLDISTCQDTIKGIQFECSIGTPAGSTFKIWAVRA